MGVVAAHAPGFATTAAVCAKLGVSPGRAASLLSAVRKKLRPPLRLVTDQAGRFWARGLPGG